MSQILCLANSPKEGARCIAGLELSTEALVRPVSESKSQAIPNEWTILNGKPIQPLDVIEIPFTSGDAVVPYQMENRFCRENWKYVESRKTEELIPFCEPNISILHTASSDAIPERHFELRRLPQSKWKSLQLIRAKRVSVYTSESGRWRAKFYSKDHKEFDLRITDDCFARENNFKENKSIDDCLLLVSLSKPWRHRCASKTKPLKCYKLIAGIMPL